RARLRRSRRARAAAARCAAPDRGRRAVLRMPPWRAGRRLLRGPRAGSSPPTGYWLAASWDSSTATVIRSWSLRPLAGTSRIDEAWNVVLPAAAAAERLVQDACTAAFARGEEGGLRRVPEGDRDAIVVWRAGEGWSAVLPPHDPRRAL